MPIVMCLLIKEDTKWLNLPYGKRGQDKGTYLNRIKGRVCVLVLNVKSWKGLEWLYMYKYVCVYDTYYQHSFLAHANSHTMYWQTLRGSGTVHILARFVWLVLPTWLRDRWKYTGMDSGPPFAVINLPAMKQRSYAINWAITPTSLIPVTISEWRQCSQ